MELKNDVDVCEELFFIVVSGYFSRGKRCSLLGDMLFWLLCGMFGWKGIGGSWRGQGRRCRVTLGLD